MTVSASYTPVQVQGDNTELDFDFTFKVFNTSDVVVALINRTTLVATAQTISTHYTVTLNTSTPGGTIHFLAGTAPTTAYDVSIRRTMTLIQSADIPSGGLFREVQVENAFDKAMMIVQEHMEILTRTLAQSPYGTVLPNLTLPLPVAGKSIGWNAAGTALVNDPGDFAAAIAAVQALVVLATNAKDAAVSAQGLAESAKDSADADVILTHADVVLTHADVVLTHLDAAATALDKIATAADRVQTNLDKIATAADRVQTGLDADDTAADVVLTHADVVLTHADVVLTHADAVQTALDRIATGLDVISTAAYAAALKGTSVTSNAIGTGAKTFATQASKQFTTGQFILIVDGDNSANFMHGQVTSYSGTALVVDVQSIGGSGTKTNWLISVSGNRGAIGPAGTLPIAAAAGTVDAITADYTPDTALADMAMVAFVASGANTSATPTFAPDGLAARTITKQGGAALLAGDIPAAGFVAIVEYNLASTRWELLNPATAKTAENLSGTPALPNGTTATTQVQADNSTKIATTAYVDAGLVVLRDISGLTWNATTDAYVRTGALAGQTNGVVPPASLLPIQSKMRRCVVLDDGTVNYYLGATDSTKKEDMTTASDLSGADGQVMVEIPKFWYKHSYAGSTHTWEISPVAVVGFSVHPAFLSGATELDYIYVGAYEAVLWDATNSTYIDYAAGATIDTAADKLSSVTAKKPVTNHTRAGGRAMAAKRGTNWTGMLYDVLSAVQLLYLVEYASFNSQSVIGVGICNVDDWPASSYYPFAPTGNSNSIGNVSGNTASAGAIHSAAEAGHYMSYRGIENWYGHIQKWLDGINTNGNRSYVCNVAASLDDDTATGYTDIGVSNVATNGYQASLLNIARGFLPGSVGADAATKITDYYYQGTGWRVAFSGGHADAALDAGGFYLRLDGASASSAAYVGSRLCFRK